MKYVAVYLLVAGVLFAVTSRWFGGGPEDALRARK